jgi:DNA-binding MarR family transcriptional regulator
MTAAQPMIEDSATLHKLLQVMEQFRELDPEMPIQRVCYFLWVALHPDCLQADVGTALGISESSRSRNKDILSDFGHGKTKPLGFVKVTEDPSTRKTTNMLSLTEKGRAMCRKIILVLSGKRD